MAYIKLVGLPYRISQFRPHIFSYPGTDIYNLMTVCAADPEDLLDILDELSELLCTLPQGPQGHLVMVRGGGRQSLKLPSLHNVSYARFFRG